MPELVIQVGLVEFVDIKDILLVTLVVAGMARFYHEKGYAPHP